MALVRFRRRVAHPHPVRLFDRQPRQRSARPDRQPEDAPQRPGTENEPIAAHGGSERGEKVGTCHKRWRKRSLIPEDLTEARLAVPAFFYIFLYPFSREA